MRSNERLANRHDLFLAEVEESDDGFGTIAQSFSKGLLGLGAGSSLDDDPAAAG
jgi:hypothetical protein